MSVEMEHISVSFAGVTVLKDVSLSVEDGIICGVLGANGSGKSTLIKVLTGIYHPDKGSDSEITIAGQKCSDIPDSNEAYRMGVRAVHQESPLIDDFTVAECIAAFKGYPKKNGRIDWKGIKEYAERLLLTYEISLETEQLVRELSAMQRNMLAIAIAIGQEEEQKQTKLLILDESEASIPENEAEFFLKRVKMLAAKGIPIIMISHRLKAVLQYCDTVVILNDGEMVFHGNVGDITEEIIVSQMLRRDGGAQKETDAKREHTLTGLWDLLKCKTQYQMGAEVLRVENLKYGNLNGCSFELYAGDILGIVGVADSGISELPWLLSGRWSRKDGEIYVGGSPLPRHMSTRKAIKNGLVLLPSDRPKSGGVMECSARENLFMPNEKKYWSRKKLSRRTLQMMQEIFDIQPRDSFEKKFGTFSGGNQQKAIMAKWMSLKPKVFVLDDPTYGVDPNSRQRLFALLKEAAAQGMGIIVFSTEPEQLADLCTRIVVIREGKAAGQIQKKDGILERETIARWSYL